MIIIKPSINHRLFKDELKLNDKNIDGLTTQVSQYFRYVKIPERHLG